MKSGNLTEIPLSPLLETLREISASGKKDANLVIMAKGGNAEEKNLDEDVDVASGNGTTVELRRE